MDSAYHQFVARIAAEAETAASACASPASFAWLAGDWDWFGHVVPFRKATYGITRNSAPFLIYNAPADLWLLILMEPGAYGLLIGRGPGAGETRFTGDVTISEQPVRLRQTWRMIDENLVIIENERLNGALWQRWDSSQLRRISSPEYSGATGMPAIHTELPLPPSTPD